MSKKKKKQKIQSRDNSTNLGFQSINPPNLEIPKSDPKPLKKSKTTGIPKEVANRMELTLLKDLVVSSSIYYDPSDSNTNIETDNVFMDIYKVFQEVDPIEEDNDLKWVLFS